MAHDFHAVVPPDADRRDGADTVAHSRLGRNSAEFGEHCRAGNGIRHVIVAAPECEMVSRPIALVRRSSPTIGP